MNRRAFVASAASSAASSIVASTGHAAAGEAPSLRSQLLGAWSLIENSTHFKDEIVPRYPPPASGILMYQDNGWMSVQITGARPTVASLKDFASLSLDDRFKLVTTYNAYFGRFEVDDTARSVTHHISDCLFPHEKGLIYTRNFQLEGDTLTLTTPPTDGTGRWHFYALAWKRIN